MFEIFYVVTGYIIAIIIFYSKRSYYETAQFSKTKNNVENEEYHKLIELLSRYNYTILESDPDDKIVAVFRSSHPVYIKFIGILILFLFILPGIIWLIFGEERIIAQFDDSALNIFVNGRKSKQVLEHYTSIALSRAFSPF